MKNFARGTKKRLGRDRSVSKKKKGPLEDVEIDELFGDIPDGESGTIFKGENSEIDTNVIESSNTGESIFQLAYPTEENDASSSIADSSFKEQQVDPLNQKQSERVAKTPSSFATPESRSRRRSTRLLAGGDRPSLSGIGLTFKQPPESGDERHRGYSSDIEILLAEIEEWKAKYYALKSEYESLSQDYDALLAQRARTKRGSVGEKEKDAKILALEAEINRLRISQGEAESKRISEAEKKIIQQNEEIQKLLDLQGIGAISAGNDAVTGAFDQDRLINNLRATIKEKDATLEELTNELQIAKSELARLGGVIGLVADQAEKDEKKKKKSWWGGSKKKKQDPTKLTAAELDALARDASTFGGLQTPRSMASEAEDEKPQRSPRLAVSEDLKVASASRGVGVAGAALSRSSPSSDMANVIVNKRMLELERENARLEGEIEILGKEKQALGEKLKRAEAQTEILQKAKKMDEEHLQAIAVSKSLSVPLPKDGGSEADRLRVVVQLQEAALQRLSIKSQQLEDTIQVYTNRRGNIEQEMDQKEQKMQKELSDAFKDASMLKQEKHRLTNEILLQQSKLAAYELEVQRLKDVIAQSQDLSRKGAARLKLQSDNYAFMLGNLLKDNGNLQEQLMNTKSAHKLDVKVYQGEVRNLREGRLQRLAGDRPDRRVFPSYPPDKTFPFRLPEASEEIPSPRPSPTSATSETSPLEPLKDEVGSDASPSSLLPSPKARKLSGAEKISPELTRYRPSCPSVEALPVSPTMSYSWTPKGYVLRPDVKFHIQSPSSSPQPYHANLQPAVRPVVSVELQAGDPGPFPSAVGSNLRQPSSLWTGLIDYPEVNPRDQALAQSALRGWLEGSTASPLRMVVPSDDTKASAIGMKASQFADSRNPSPSFSVPPLSRHGSLRTFDIPASSLAFNPLSSRSDSKMSLEERKGHTGQHPHRSSVSIVAESDWGTNMPAALLSFGRPAASLPTQEALKKRTHNVREVVRKSAQPLPTTLAAFPSNSLAELEIQQEPQSPLLKSTISPPSTSHPLLRKSGIGVSHGDKTKPPVVNVKTEDPQSSLPLPLSSSTPLLVPLPRKRVPHFPSPISPKQTEKLSLLAEDFAGTKPSMKEHKAPQPPTATYSPPEAHPSFESELPLQFKTSVPGDRILESTEKVRRGNLETDVCLDGPRQLSNDNLDGYKRRFPSEDDTFPGPRRIRQKSSSGNLIDDLSLSSKLPKSGESFTPTVRESRLKKSVQLHLPQMMDTVPPSIQRSFSAELDALSHDEVDTVSYQQSSPKSRIDKKQDPLQKSAGAAGHSDSSIEAFTAHHPPYDGADLSEPDVRNSARSPLAREQASGISASGSIANLNRTSVQLDTVSPHLTTKETLSTVRPLHPQDVDELDRAGELFGFKGNIEDLDRMLEDDNLEQQWTPPGGKLRESTSGAYNMRQEVSDSRNFFQGGETTKGNRFNDSFSTDSSFESKSSRIKETPNFDIRRGNKMERGILRKTEAV